MSEAFKKSGADVKSKLNNFEKYVKRQCVARFLARYELFKMQKNISGSIVECGVHEGAGVFAWAKLSSTLEPYAMHRKVIGFDTFEGFVSVASQDGAGNKENPNLKEGAFAEEYDVYNEMLAAKAEYDENRFINQFEKIELIKGDACKSIPEYLKQNEHLIVSLLFLDFDLYEPTKVALEHFLPRVPKGGIIAFDQVNNPAWPGETLAMLEKMNLNNHCLQRFEFDPNISYLVL